MNVFYEQGIFFPVPAELVDGDHLSQLNGAVIKVYIALLRLAQRHSAVELHLADYELHELTGLDSKTIRSARRILEKTRLINSGKGPNGIAVYVLLNLSTGERLPAPIGKDGRRYSGIKYHSFRRHNAPRLSRTVKRQAPAHDSADAMVVQWSEIGCRGAENGREDLLTRKGKVPDHLGKNPSPSASQAKENKDIPSPAVSLKSISEKGISLKGDSEEGIAGTSFEFGWNAAAERLHIQRRGSEGGRESEINR